MRIAVVAPSCTLSRHAAEKVEALASARGDCEISIHPQCFLTNGHFAGSDSDRFAAVHEVMADPSVAAVWFARGGYGSNRIAGRLIDQLPLAARSKTYLGYSDAGFLLSGLHNVGLDVAWGPMPQDVLRDHGDEAIGRALDWLVRRERSAIEPDLQAPAMAFNLTVLAMTLGTPLQPEFADADLLIEEIGEQYYRIDRLMFQLTSNPQVRKVARIRLGRVGDVPSNTPAFGTDELAIVEDWCRRSGIAFGGRADIGHDAHNKVVPFGRRQS